MPEPKRGKKEKAVSFDMPSKMALEMIYHIDSVKKANGRFVEENQMKIEVQEDSPIIEQAGETDAE